MLRNVQLDVYKVTKPIKVNDEAINQIGDILVIDEDGYDGANVDNLTQGWGFKCFGQYDSVNLITKVNMTWEGYMSLIHGTQNIKESFIKAIS